MTTLFLTALVAGTAALAQATPPAPALKITMISLGVKDMAASVKFYTETLGLALAGKPGEVTLVRGGDVLIALNAPLGKSSGERIVGAVEVIFGVENVSAAYANLAARGCTFAAIPHEIFPGTWAATLTDPDGHKLTVLGPK